MSANSMIVEIVRQRVGEWFDQRQRLFRLAGVRYGNCVIERNHRRWLDLGENPIELFDLDPIGLGKGPGTGVKRGNCRLELIRAGTAKPEGTIRERGPLGNGVAVP